jgi:hypothetical protein
MYKIAAFIEFDKKITNKILSKKKNFKKKFGNQIYLNHPVHLTLFTLYIKKISELKKIYINNSNKYSKAITINLFKSGIFFNDPITNGHTFFYYIRKTKKISEIQLNNLKKINNKINVLKKNINQFKLPILKKNYKRFGFPFVGEIWIPHTTISSIEDLKQNDKFVKNFLSSKINLKCQVNEIKFYKIHKDKHDFLFNVKNF